MRKIYAFILPIMVLLIASCNSDQKMAKQINGKWYTTDTIESYNDAKLICVTCLDFDYVDKNQGYVTITQTLDGTIIVNQDEGLSNPDGSNILTINISAETSLQGKYVCEDVTSTFDFEKTVIDLNLDIDKSDIKVKIYKLSNKWGFDMNSEIRQNIEKALKESFEQMNIIEKPDGNGLYYYDDENKIMIGWEEFFREQK